MPVENKMLLTLHRYLFKYQYVISPSVHICLLIFIVCYTCSSDVSFVMLFLITGSGLVGRMRSVEGSASGAEHHKREEFLQLYLFKTVNLCVYEST